ncbi:MAG: leucine-rich repeat protein, partial [Clostridia bacterium]|nr:leucine-rich repeat protein [Clostridia bacterium]
MKKFISLVLALSLLMSTVNIALPISVYAESENTDVWTIENSIESVESEPYDTTETEETAEAYSMLQPNSEDAYSISLMASFEFSSLTGKVLDSSGQGVSGVSVQLYNIDENVCLTACTTGASGTWSSVEYDVIAGYTYIIRYYKAGYEFSNNNIECIATSGGTTLETVTATALDVGNLVCEPNDYEYTINEEKATITEYKGDDTAILLPSELGGYPVTAIGSEVFEGNTNIVTACLSENITEIGWSAFCGCTNLKNVYFPNILTSIGGYAFQDCTALSKLAFPNSLTTINNSAFSGCTGFTSIELPDSVTTIKSNAFSNCANLNSINFPLSWKTADSNIFYNCPKLKEITVPEGITTIPSEAFYNAQYLET